jgi:hypothetical protein
MFVMPLFFYFFVRYLQEGKAGYLLGNIIALYAIIQFQMADGIPFAILSFVACIVKIFQTRRFVHLLLFSLFAIFLGNFIIFDFRHEHLLFAKVMDFLSPMQKGHQFNYITLISNRVSLLFSSPEILRRNIGGIANTILFLVVLLSMLASVKKEKYSVVYLSFVYLYGGFFALSFLNKGQILYFYLFPIFPLVFLMFASLIDTYKKIFIVLFTFVVLANSMSVFADIKDSQSIIGRDLYSWKFLSDAASIIYSEKDASFGYFVYSPDVIAYEGRYAMLYQAKLHPEKIAKEFTKEPVTYLFVAPPPRNNPYMHDDWWRLNQLNITPPAQTLKIFPNGYKIQKILLSEDDLKIPFDPNINTGITFR